MIILLLRALAFLRRDRSFFARTAERSRCVAMVLAQAEYWHLRGVPEFAEEFTMLAERMRCGR